MNAAHVERCVALLAIPDCCTLIDEIRADCAFLIALCKTFHVENALLSEVGELADEVFVVVLDLRFIFAFSRRLLFDHLQLFGCSILLLVLDVICS